MLETQGFPRVGKRLGRSAMIVWVVLAAASGEVAAQGPRFKLGPAIEVGRHHTFTQVLVAALGPDNRLAVSQPQDYSVLLFDLARPDSPVAVLGRRGQGPGEFSEPGGIGWIGKTLWVADRGRPRVEVFDPSGKVVASKFYDAPRSSSRVLRYIGPTALMRDSTVVYYPVVIGTIRDPAVFPEDPSFPVLLLRHQAPKADTIAQLRLLRGQLALRGDRHGGAVSGIASQPFSNLNFFHSGADGRRVLLVIQSEPESHEGRALVKVVSPTGAEIYRKVLGLPPRAVSNSEWDSLVTSWAKVYASDTWSTEQKDVQVFAKFSFGPSFTPWSQPPSSVETGPCGSASNTSTIAWRPGLSSLRKGRTWAPSTFREGSG